MKIKKLSRIFAVLIFAICAVVVSCAKTSQLPEPPPTLAQLADKIKYGVVEIATLEEKGSGVIVRAGDKTEIITNYHVIETAVKYGDEIGVKFWGGSDYYVADVLGYFADYDLAVLEVNDKFPLSYVFKFASEVSLAEDVLALGYNDGSLAAFDGIISMTEKVLEYGGKNHYVIQSTTGFATGSSGGALVNLKGELVGITTFANSFNGEFIFSGTGYSVPSDIAAAVYGRIKKGVESGTKPYKPAAGYNIYSNGKVGVTISPTLNFELKRTNEGIFVSYAITDCPLKEGDKIASINGREVKTMTAVIAEILRTHRETVFEKN